MLKPTLAQEGVQVGRDRFFEVLRQHDLLLAPRPAAYPSTTRFNPALPVFTNQIKELQLNGPNQVWVADLTYLRTEMGFLYLALLTDKWSRKIVGYYCGESLETEVCLRALHMAMQDLPAEKKPMHHSDRGTQYCSHEYVDQLTARKLPISMTEIDHCAENAMAERVNGILKNEYGLDQEFKTKQCALAAAKQAIWLYNTRRPHTALNYRVPEQVHSLAA